MDNLIRRSYDPPTSIIFSGRTPLAEIELCNMINEQNSRFNNSKMTILDSKSLPPLPWQPGAAASELSSGGTGTEKVVLVVPYGSQDRRFGCLVSLTRAFPALL